MEKLLSFLSKSKILSISLGGVLLIAGVLSRIQFAGGNTVIGFIIPLLFISVSFGIIFSTIFKKENKITKGIFIKSILAPLAIVIVLISLDKFGIKSPLIRTGSLFLINVTFFNKEIIKGLN